MSKPVRAQIPLVFTTRPEPQSPERSEGDAGRPLGTYARIAATPILEPSRQGEYERAVAVVERYALQAQARKAMYPDDWYPEGVKFHKSYKVTKCLRTRLPNSQAQVWLERSNQTAHWKNLQVCASVWHCPVCAARIANHRRLELRSALETCKDNGYKVYLLTMTAPHYVSDDVNDLLKGMAAAWRRFTADRAYKAVKADMGFVGLIRAQEVTYGENGFHPHYHALFICKGIDGEVVSPYQLKRWLYPSWSRGCVRSGLPEPSFKHGLDVQDGEDAFDYAAKWGLEHEMTTHHIKRGKAGGLHPWDFLRAALEGQEDALKLFRVYAKAFHGRRQLYWSRGLKALLVPDDVAIDSDEEVMATEEPSDMLAELTDDQWRAVRYYNAQAHVLNAAERSPEDFHRFLAELVHHLPTDETDQRLYRTKLPGKKRT